MTHNPLPQRLAPQTSPGDLLKGAAMSRPRRVDGFKDGMHLSFIRQLPCLYCGMEPSEAAHVRFASAAFAKASGLGKKPSDNWTAPLCAQHHRLATDAQHNRGERAFWNDLGINVLIVCQALYAKSGDLPAMRAIVFCSIAEREAASQCRELGKVRDRHGSYES